LSYSATGSELVALPAPVPDEFGGLAGLELGSAANRHPVGQAAVFRRTGL
jgi:hypothetical protein